MDAICSEKYSDPFSIKIQATELYSNPLIDQFYSILLNSIGGKDFLILVIGESQSGKTTFLSKLISQIEQNVKLCRLKIRESDNPAAKNKYYPVFLYKTEHNQVIILDDGHNLNSQELSIILKDAWNSSKKSKQVVLFCESKINTTISSVLKKMPKRASVNKLYIPSFDKEQTESYIKHYLEAANFSGKFPFSKKNIKNIFEKSKGLSGKINHEAQKIFLDKNLFASNTKQFKFNLSVICVITIFLFFIIGGIDISKKTGFIPIPSSNIVLSERFHVNSAPKNQILINNDQIKKTDNIVKPNLIKESDKKEQTSQKITTETMIAEKNIIEPINIAAITTEMSFQKQISKPESAITNKIKKEEKTKTASSFSLFQEKWIMAQNPQEYTIQIMAGKEKNLIDWFLSLNINTQNEIAYYKMYYKGGVWYKVISGKYKTLEKARTACYNLPEQLKKLGPWPRYFASIHNDIDKFIKINKTD